MKCIQCGTNNNLQDRTTNQGRCKKCGHLFAFEPTTMTAPLKLTDKWFQKNINAISGNGTFFLTQKQFFYLTNKRLKKTYDWDFSKLKGCATWGGFPTWGRCETYIVGFLFLQMLLSMLINFLTFKYFVLFSVITCQAILICCLFRESQKEEYFYPRRMRFTRNSIVVGVVTIAVGGWLNLILAQSFPLFLITIALGLFSIYLGQQQRAKTLSMPVTDFVSVKKLMVDENQFQEWIDRWVRANGSIGNLLTSPREENLPAQINLNMGSYSFDRVVVCDRSTIAQMLIANDFHFQKNCAILSSTGYPQSIFSQVMEMLRRNPDLKVYAFHDASPKGVGLVHHLQSSEHWFANGNATIYDLGLLPRQILKNEKMFIQYSEESAREAKTISEAVKPTLSADEIAWLEQGKFVELESFGPKKLMQVLSQGIAMTQEYSQSTESSLVAMDYDDFDDSGSGVYLMTSETFG